MGRQIRRANPATPEQLAQKAKDDEAERLARAAKPPTPEELREMERQKEKEFLEAQATPGFRPAEEHKCAGQLFKVASSRAVIHGKSKGENVTLCPHKGATKALVESGHLVPTQPATARAVTVNAAASKADDTKGADHG
jgi:hypothetical protein